MKFDTYIFDMDGTLGVFTGCPVEAGEILLRPGVQETHQQLRQDGCRINLATRGGESYALDVIKRLAKLGMTFDDVRTDSQVSISNSLCYKRLDGLYEDPERTVIIGDMLRLYDQRLTIEGYLQHDFVAKPDALTSFLSLLDHPLPKAEGTPLYVVVPQPWTLCESELVTLDMRAALRYCQTGQGNVQEVASDDLAQKVFNMQHVQQYAIVKGTPDDWRPLEQYD